MLAQKQRTRDPLGETQKDDSQETHHSTNDLNASVQPPNCSQTASAPQADEPMRQEEADLPHAQAEEPPDCSQIDEPMLQDEADPSQAQAEEPVTAQRNQIPKRTERKPRVKWPKATETGVWEDFEHELELILESTLQGPAEKKLKSMTHLLYTIGKERFGVQEKKTNPTPPQPNRRERKIKTIRKDLKHLKKAFKKASPDEKQGLKELRDQQRKELATLRRAENLRMKSRKNAKRRAAFVANPYQFSKRLMDKEKSGTIANSVEEVQEYIRSVHSDPEKQIPLGDCPRIEDEQPPTTQFDVSEPKLSEIRDVVKKARSSSAPGPNGIPYKVYKMCPLLTRRLWRLIKVIWRKEKVPEEWQKAEGIFTPKEKDSKDISQFRTISLLNVEGKIFFSVLSKRLTNYLLKNNYVDTSVQKGGVPGFSGCIEHTSAISQLLREARVNKSDLTVVWLDLTNAYGSISHQILEKAHGHYHISGQIKKLLKDYLSKNLPKICSQQRC